MTSTQSQKIFCIGLHKTGTKSLEKAFRILGLNPAHFNTGKKIPPIPENLRLNEEKNLPLLTNMDEFDAYCDMLWPPVNHLFTKLDQQYPNSKFIFNTRNLDDWLKSRRKQMLKIDLKKFKQRYPGNTLFTLDLNAWRKEYVRHHAQVREYFKNRPDDILEINICEGDGWEKLCPFLGLPIPNVPFPFENKGENRLKIIVKTIYRFRLLPFLKRLPLLLRIKRLFLGPKTVKK